MSPSLDLPLNFFRPDPTTPPPPPTPHPHPSSDRRCVLLNDEETVNPPPFCPFSETSLLFLLLPPLKLRVNPFIFPYHPHRIRRCSPPSHVDCGKPVHPRLVFSTLPKNGTALSSDGLASAVFVQFRSIPSMNPISPSCRTPLRAVRYVNSSFT